MYKIYKIRPCTGREIFAQKGQTITVVDVAGGQVVDFFAENAKDAGEYLSPGVTMDCNESLRLSVGGFLYSNRYRPMLRVLTDAVGEHDLLHPCCRKEMYDFFYHNGAAHPNCLENINTCLKSSRPEIYPVNLFMHTAVSSNGDIAVKKPLSKPGDTIVFSAQMDVRLGVAACSVAESDCNGGVCTPVTVIIADVEK